MGNRVKGRPKKSSIKAAISSSAGSKRKLSRFGKKRKAEHAGLEATFIGRSKCLRILQVSIKDFRRLCILKGIYPREPNGRVPGNKKGQTFYHVKDIRAIAHEPVLEKFREFRAFMKKVRRAAGRNERGEARRRHELLPTYSLYHIVKERYPRFLDALSDLDDALTLVYLFAALPSAQSVSPGIVNQSKKLAAAWGAYCATTSTIVKAFISVKGVYVEATIQNVPIRWVIPHSFTQFMPDDVDFRIMKTFLEFYGTLLNFVLFKLYNDLSIRYPFPTKELGGETVGSTSALLAANLRALTNALDSSNTAITEAVSESVKQQSTELVAAESAHKKTSSDLIKSVDAALNQLEDDDEDDDDDESVDVSGPLQAALENAAEEEGRVPGVDDESLKRKRLFAGLVFFLSREIPRGYLDMVALSFGAKVGWEGPDSPVAMNDPSITHHIVDRPRLPNAYKSLPKSRDHVQPQWIVDCANFMYLLPIARYAVGATLPPHLSPWVDDEEEGYKPKYAEEIERLKNGEPIETDTDEIVAQESHVGSEDEAVDVIMDDEVKPEDDDEEEVEMDEKLAKAKQQQKRKKEQDEAHKLAKTMMTKKAAHLYGRMQYGIARKQANVDALHERRKELDVKEPGRPKGKEKDDSGKTPLKLKVERLKQERKTLESTYTATGGSMKRRKNRKN